MEKPANRARNDQNCVNFGQKWPFLNFPQNSETIIFSTPETKFKTKKLENSNEWISIKMRKTPFLGTLDQNGQFLTVFGQNGRNRIFFQKKRLENFFRIYEF